jgi:serine/threonine-protein kinase
MDQSIDPLAGRQIAGKFVIERLLGAGAMGAVYRARQLALDKVVAIKILHPRLAADASFADRFASEAKAASRLDHPNSIRVFDFGREPDGLLYIAMEYVDGRDLFTVIEEGRMLSPSAIVDILSQVLAALAVAHDMGVFHRDVKPEHVMVLRGQGDDGRPVDVIKVCDFGIAKILAVAQDSADALGRRHSTAGVVVGTPAYIAPEQARGERVDARSDLYSVGVILYVLLTGREPFTGETPLGIALKHVTDAPARPSSIAEGVHPGLEAVCLKALEKKPVDRYQSAREMRLALRAAIGTANLATRTSERSLLSVPPVRDAVATDPTLFVGSPRRSRAWVGVGAGAVVLTIGTALYVEHHAATQPEHTVVVAETQPPVQPPPPEPPAPGPPAGVAATPSPDVPTPPQPAFDLATARVEMGQPMNMAGGLNATTVGRTLRPATPQLTACYRTALPKMSGTLEGPATLHFETDGSGLITDARVVGPLGKVGGRCMAGVIQGRSISGVDTGTASADIPLVFKAK